MMPSPKGEAEGKILSPMDNRVSPGGMESPSPKYFVPQAESPPKFSENGNSKASRINAKRKPDKSKIFRIRTNESENENQIVCSECQAEFPSKEEYEEHQKLCLNETQNRITPSSEVCAEDRDHRHPEDLQRHQDEANNNQANLTRKSPTHFSPYSRSSSVDRSITGYDSDCTTQEEGPLERIRQLLQQSNAASSSSQVPIAQQLAQSNMALEAIQNTRMALAQLASNALGNGQPVSPQVMQEMAVLQSTLYTLQHQQMMQLQLIQQLQAQLSIKNKDNETTRDERNDLIDSREDKEELRENSSPPPSCSSSVDKQLPSTVASSFLNTLMERFRSTKEETINEKSISNLLPSLPNTNDSRDRPLSPPMTASNIASAVIQHTDSPPSDEPNTLEMLQRTANQVLSNASHGLLTNRLIDDYNKPPDGKDTYYKHRCRYCGKVFGSDSALQIHVRSHTGERPFKCNICGNRFTTKGNLKVHFQRHASRFPHVKMNPHPVPEHLDKLHPPLLAQLGELKDYPSPPTGPPNPFASSSLGNSLPPFRLPGSHQPTLDLTRVFNASELTRREMPHLEIEEPENNSRSNNDFDSDEDLKLDMGINTDHTPSSREESKEKDNIDNDNEISEKENSLNTRDKEINLMNGPNFRDQLEDELKNNIPEEISETTRELLRDSISNHTRESETEDEKERIEEPLGREHLDDRKLLSRESTQNIFREPFMESLNDAYRESQEFSKDSNFEKNHNKAADANSSAPLDIRIKGDHDLKDSSNNDKRAKDEMDTDSNDSRSLSSDHPTDLRIRSDFRPLSFPNIQFPGPRLPFPFIPGISPHFFPSSAPPNRGALPPNFDPAKDPNIYSSLLPRPGSTDNSWEALIEVEKSSETMKLEHLVNNIEHKLNDPNQCVICHRVLSCKSALQMHYRTHTGERPFKCKICGRAFTTKGNLKTHMGVHRAKPPMRMLHQCPVCHKKFTNALVLQQHIRLHTGEPTDLSPEQIAAAEVRDFPPSMPIQTSLPPMLPGGFPLPTTPIQGFQPLPLHLRYQLSPEMIRRYEMESEESRKDEEEKYLRLINTSPRSSSTSSAEQRMAEDLSMRMKGDSNVNGASSPHHSVSPNPSDYSDIDDKIQEGRNESPNTVMDKFTSPSISQAMVTMNQENGASSGPLDLASRPSAHLFSPFGLFQPHLSTSSQISPVTQTLPSMSPLYMSNIPGRGNTTCQVCFKIFACQSALEIHYRSHTKERPFKCAVCERGFSTKGNMKQHMLTHKMREGTYDDLGHNHGARGCSRSAPILSKEESSEDPASKRDDAGIKREHEGEIHFPVSKRSSAQPDEDHPGDTDEQPYSEEPPFLSPEEQVQRLPTPTQDTSPTISHNSLHPPFRLHSSLHRATSLPLPPSLSIPTSLAFSSPLSLPIGPPPTSIALAPSHPLPNS